MDDKLILALDFGGTKLSAAITTANRSDWLAQRRVFTPATADGPYEYAAMLTMARELIAEVGRPAAVGVSFGGPVDAQQGLVRLSHHVARWENMPLRDSLQAEFGVPAAVDNDANVAALGEYRFGAGRGCSSLLYVTVSTGIGGGWVINGRIYSGYNGMAGEIGHTIVNPGGMLCVCGKRGCLEAEACGTGIANRARQMIQTNPEVGAALLKRVGQTAETITAQHISLSAPEDALARQILMESAYLLGRGLANAIVLLNPQRVILGGGVTKSGALWWQTVTDTTRQYVLPEFLVDIVPAQFSDDAPLWGAVALVA